MDKSIDEAWSNYQNLKKNAYPGRGIVIGYDDKAHHLVQVYWIMGRSENSRNRVFSKNEGRLFTEPADPAKVKDTSLIIYDAMLEHGPYFVVSNGEQTATALTGFAQAGMTLDAALRGATYEPDAPNFTPRITGACLLKQEPSAYLSLLRKSPFGSGCDRIFYRYSEFQRGIGWCITTYAGDGSPLPAFRGEPLLMPIDGNIEAVANLYWDALNEENRVSLAVKFINLASSKSRTYVINKYRKAG